jgi:hypothetical protein
MNTIRSKAQEASEDVYFGQVVANWARWFIIAAGIVLVLWTADSTAKVIIGVLPVVGLMALNFYLHGRHLASKPANTALITVASLIDVALITGLVVLWPGARGLNNDFFVLYFPVLLAFTFVMQPRVSLMYTGAVLAVYTAVTILADPGLITGAEEIELLVTRLITLGAVGALGAYFWRIQRDRRREAIGQAA